MSTKQSPGYRIDLTDDIMQSYPDIFEGYLEEEYGETGGTVFRFPLRKRSSTCQEMAKDEQVRSISAPVSCEEINKLFSDFKEYIHECLLFLRNVTEISLRRATSNNGGKSIQEILVVHAETTEPQKYATFSSQLSIIAADLASGNLKVADVQKREYCFRVTTTDDKDTTKQWIVVRRLGLEDSTKENMPEVLQVKDDKCELKFVPRADVAYMLNCNERQSCRLFCFLPLPDKQELPVHINGHFALEYENRRNLWKLEDGGYKAKWNICILEGVVAPAYLKLLQELKDSLPSPMKHADLRQYRDAFPVISHEENMTYIKKMSLAVYALISARDAELLPAYSNRIPLTLENLQWVAPLCRTKHRLSPCFASLDMACSEVSDTTETTMMSIQCSLASDHREESEVVRETLVASGFQLIISSFSSLFRNFRKAGVNVIESTGENVLTFYQTQYRLRKTRCKLIETSFQKSSNLVTVLHYCSAIRLFKIRLLQTSLLLTADEYLQTFNPADPKFVCKHQSIAPTFASNFVHKDFVRVSGLNPFKDICLCKKFGLVQFSIVLDELLPRAEFQNKSRMIDDMIPVISLFCYISVNLTDHSESEENRMTVSMRWLKEVWAFLAHELHFNAHQITTCYFEKLSHKLSKNSKKEVFEKRLMAAQLAAGNYCQWCLVPVIAGNNRLLVPIEKITGVMHHSDIMQSFSSNLCERLKIPTFDSKIFDIDLQWLADIYKHSACNTAMSVIKSFSIFDYSHVIIQRAESEELVNFFAHHLELWKDVLQVVQTLRRLCLFEDISGRVVHLCDFDECNLICDDLLEVSKDCPVYMHALSGTCRAVFLKHNRELENFMLQLQCKKLTSVDYYTKYVFEYFQVISETERMTHLNFICFRLIPILRLVCQFQPVDAGHGDCQYCILCKHLRELPFLHTANNTDFEVASFFYDPRVPLFKNMVDKSLFPPIYFPNKTDDWLNFLCKCGLMCEVTEDKLLEFARKISRFPEQQVNAEQLYKRVDKMANMIFNDLVYKFANEKKSDTVTLFHTGFQPGAIYATGYCG